MLLNKGDEKNIRTEIVLNENISAPLEYLEPVGVQKCYLNDELINKMYLKCGIYVYTEILFSLKKEGKSAICGMLEGIMLCEISKKDKY